MINFFEMFRRQNAKRILGIFQEALQIINTHTPRLVPKEGGISRAIKRIGEMSETKKALETQLQYIHNRAGVIKKFAPDKYGALMNKIGGMKV